MTPKSRKRDDRGRPPQPERASGMVERFVDAVSPETPEADVQTAWPEAVGQQVAEVTRVAGERDGVVTVECESAVWAEELGLMEVRIREGLNRVLAARGGEPIEAISFRALGT